LIEKTELDRFVDLVIEGRSRPAHALAKVRARDLFLVADRADQLPDSGGKALGLRRKEAAYKQRSRRTVVVDHRLDLTAGRPLATPLVKKRDRPHAGQESFKVAPCPQLERAGRHRPSQHPPKRHDYSAFAAESSDARSCPYPIRDGVRLLKDDHAMLKIFFRVHEGRR